MSDVDIGRNVQALRGDFSQAALAAAMREKGHKWSQATVWSIEKGDRPLRVTEAVDLASVLDVLLDAIIQDSNQGHWARMLDADRERLQESRQRFVDASERFFFNVYLESQNVQSYLKEVQGDSSSELMQKAFEKYARVVDSVDIDESLGLALRRFVESANSFKESVPNSRLMDPAEWAEMAFRDSANILRSVGGVEIPDAGSDE